ncbi:AAA family ATPase [Clostridium magnum]|uniref:Transposon Tn7 transposition protein TnsC n=1 Tax=Clostridium magnum DSM 2767 TaxID=1121326 RepID=A0A161X1C4_9CLOT|nr:ATP-binding protein [Clostridium magnum]KZL93248.1 transposon Tn7 transposition protein TnsC [Clostridium magnum DSM 2767]SHI19249.1 AAA domain-containing protein [Clostridium magnum DSM 2767]
MLDNRYIVYTKDGVQEGSYIDNQYEEYNNGKFLYKEQVNARYIEQCEPTYRGNMLIEALPTLCTIEQLVYKLVDEPVYSELERDKNIEYRIQAITRLKNYVTVLARHIEIEKKFSAVIRRGYTSKHIGTPEFIRGINFTSKLIHNKWIEDKLKQIQCFYNNTVTSMPGFAVIGISGGGKSTALNKILSLYPQCIVHTRYKEDKFLFKQLVWIKIDCSYNGGLKGICLKFFKEVDSVLGSDYLQRFGNQRNNTDTMMAAMVHISQIHALGTLVIDEIQHLANIKEGADKVLNFLVTLENELKIPIIYIGTYKAISKVLNKDLRQARRASGIGEVEWTRMDEDEEWDDFIEGLWRYQWTKNAIPLTDDIRKAFYKNTMGITERVVNLYIAVQIEAILNGIEKVTIELINSVTKEHMMLTAPMITALQTNNRELLANFDDIAAFNLDKYIEDIKEGTEYKNQLKNIYESDKYKVVIKEKEITDTISIILDRLGFSQDETRSIVKSIINEHGLGNNMDFYMKEVGKIIKEQMQINKEAKTLGRKSVRRTKEVEKQNFYKEFEELGKIKKPEDDFGV